MLADVVAIIGETSIQLQRSDGCSHTAALTLFFFLFFFLVTGTQDIVFGEVDR